MSFDSLTGQSRVKRIKLSEDRIEPSFDFQDAGEVPHYIPHY